MLFLVSMADLYGMKPPNRVASDVILRIERGWNELR